jgi:hypothetical protein
MENELSNIEAELRTKLFKLTDKLLNEGYKNQSDQYDDAIEIGKLGEAIKAIRKARSLL